MDSQKLTNRVVSRTSSEPGRSLNTEGTNHFVIDEPSHAGGPHEALTPAGAFLSGVSSCGVLLVENAAHKRGIPLDAARCTIEATRDAEDTSWFESVELTFDLEGPSAEDARQLVDFYREK